MGFISSLFHQSPGLKLPYFSPPFLPPLSFRRGVEGEVAVLACLSHLVLLCEDGHVRALSKFKESGGDRNVCTSQVVLLSAGPFSVCKADCVRGPRRSVGLAISDVEIAFISASEHNVGGTERAWKIAQVPARVLALIFWISTLLLSSSGTSRWWQRVYSRCTHPSRLQPSNGSIELLLLYPMFCLPSFSVAGA